MIKKTLLTLLISFSIFGTCNQLNAQENSDKQEKLTPEDRNYTGEMTKEDFMTSYTKAWFKRGYENYKPSPEIVNEISNNLEDGYSVKVFMGTWCPDSRRETPKLVKLLDEAGFNNDNLTIYAMNHRKATTQNYEEGLNIHHVPTIIFYDKDGNEINRFVEHSRETFEKDILKIVSKEDYKNSYAE